MRQLSFKQQVLNELPLIVLLTLIEEDRLHDFLMYTEELCVFRTIYISRLKEKKRMHEDPVAAVKLAFPFKNTRNEQIWWRLCTEVIHRNAIHQIQIKK